jgi:hypothetical protein
MVVIKSTTEGLGADVYVSGVFVKRIESTTESMLIPKGNQRIAFVKSGYQPQFEDVDISTVINLDLKKYVDATRIIDIPDSEKILYYPNPVENTLTVQIPNPNGEKVTIVLINLTGQLAYRTETHETIHHVDMQSLAKGIYILQVMVGNEKYAAKVIKK